jgi:hypothetical protein
MPKAEITAIGCLLGGHPFPPPSNESASTTRRVTALAQVDRPTKPLGDTW